MHSDKPKIAALTQGINAPSARFRWQQYAGDLVHAGLDVSEFTSHFGAYPPISKTRRPFWLGATMAESLVRTLNSNRFDLRFLQRNLTSTLCTWEPLLRKPFVFDVDDAIFLGARGSSADRIARAASIIICGNNFLAEHFSRYGNVTVLPTAVDTLRFTPRSTSKSVKPVIGWSGSSSGLKYLYGIEPAIFSLLKKYPDAVIKIVSDRPPSFKMIPSDRVIYEPWTTDREVAVLHEFTVGIMPLEDDLWARGKCSFKMLTYMAVGLPVVVSPVGMNAEVLHHGSCGFAASTIDDWVDAVSTLLDSPALANQMGWTGREIIESRYARNVIAPKLSKILLDQL
jgi:glycosyltransferase involved in cell wall biosynthesis